MRQKCPWVPFMLTLCWGCMRIPWRRFLVKDQSLYPLPPLITWTPSVLNLCRSCVWCHSLCADPAVSGKHCRLEVIHHLWLLQPPLPCMPNPWEDVPFMKIPHLRLSSPASPLSAHCSVVCLCVKFHLLKPHERRSFSDDGWLRSWSVILSECH